MAAMKQASSLFIFGTGSLAKLAYIYANEAHANRGGENGTSLRVEGFVVDQSAMQAKIFCDLAVFSWEEFVKAHSANQARLFVAIGYKSMRSRADVFGRVRKAGYAMANIIAPASYVAKDCVLGANNIVMPGAVLEPGTKIGDNNVFWSNTTICHDTVIGDHCFFASNTTVGGEACIGNRNFFGFTSTVLHHRQIGDDNLIAAQALITKDLSSGGHYIGAPANKTKDIDPTKGVSVE